MNIFRQKVPVFFKDFIGFQGSTVSIYYMVALEKKLVLDKSTRGPLFAAKKKRRSLSSVLVVHKRGKVVSFCGYKIDETFLASLSSFTIMETSSQSKGRQLKTKRN